MLALEDERWRMLQHAYGAAADIPDLLRRLASFPTHENERTEPYFSLWSALCHQGDVYSASYAAVPHIVRLIETAADRAHWSVLLLVASIEIARSKGNGPQIATELADEYQVALARVPFAVAAASTREWDELFARVAASAIAAVKGRVDLAEAILELEPELVPRFMQWSFEQ